MNILCWNCRGMGNPSTVRQLRRWNSSVTPDILFVSETMIKKEIAEQAKDRIDFFKCVWCVEYGSFWRVVYLLEK